MGTILRRLSPVRWIYLTLAFAGIQIYAFWEDGRITPGRLAFSVLWGLASAFGFACVQPWSERFDARIRRLLSCPPR